MGVVKAVGDDVKNVKPGQRVAAASPVAMRPLGKGTFQQYSAVPQTALIAVPDSVSDETAAQFMINPGVALQLLKLCPIPKGQYLLQNAAGSVVGRILIALANFNGFKTINIVRRPAAKEQLLALGGNVVIDSSTEDVLQRVSEVTQGQGAYAAFDAIGGTASQQMLSAVRDEGTMVVYGVLSGLTMQTDITDVLFKHKVIKGFSLTRWFRTTTPKEQQAFCAELMSLLENGTIKLPAGPEFPLDDPIPAYEALASQPGGLKLMLRG